MKCPKCSGKLFLDLDLFGRKEQDGVECVNCGYDGPTRLAAPADRPLRAPRTRHGRVKL